MTCTAVRFSVAALAYFLPESPGTPQSDQYQYQLHYFIPQMHVASGAMNYIRPLVLSSAIVLKVECVVWRSESYHILLGHLKHSGSGLEHRPAEAAHGSFVPHRHATNLVYLNVGCP